MALLMTARGAYPELGLYLQQLVDCCHRGLDGGGDAGLVLSAELLLLLGTGVASQGVEGGVTLGTGHHTVLVQ